MRKTEHLLFTVTPFGKTSGVTVLVFTIKAYELYGLSKTVVKSSKNRDNYIYSIIIFKNLIYELIYGIYGLL
jgi:hypothetical protein